MHVLQDLVCVKAPPTCTCIPDQFADRGFDRLLVTRKSNTAMTMKASVSGRRSVLALSFIIAAIRKHVAEAARVADAKFRTVCICIDKLWISLRLARSALLSTFELDSAARQVKMRHKGHGFPRTDW